MAAAPDSCPNGDAPGIPIALGAGDQVRPVVTGTLADMFLVAWTDVTDVSDPTDATVRTTAVAVNGLSLDTTGSDLTAGAGARPSLQWRGMARRRCSHGPTSTGAPQTSRDDHGAGRRTELFPGARPTERFNGERRSR